MDASKHNVKFLKLKGERRALAVALRDISPGEEIYAFYGEGYWRARPTLLDVRFASISEAVSMVLP